MKKCKVCKSPFEPFSSLAVACSQNCALVHVQNENDKKAAKVKKESRQWVRVQRDRLKSKGDHTREAQQAFNSYVRARDLGLACASCGSFPDSKYGGSIDCSHYRSVGSAPHLRFNLHNAAAACVKCNRYLSGNISELRKGLINRIGERKVLAIECNQGTGKFDIRYLKRVKKVFNKKSKMYNKRYEIGQRAIQRSPA